MSQGDRSLEHPTLFERSGKQPGARNLIGAGIGLRRYLVSGEGAT